MGRILVLGDLRAEIVLQGLSGHPRRGREVFVSNARIRPGGDGARFTAALKRLGRDATLVAKVGRDDIGSALLQDLNGALSYGGLSRDPKARTGMTVLFSDDGDASAVTYPGAAASLTEQDLRRSIGPECKHLHVASPFQLLSLPLAGALRIARSRKMTVSLSAGADPRGRADFGELGPLVDLLILDEASAKEGRRSGAPLVVVRRGEKGAVAATAGREWKASGLATGPAFDAAFVDGWLEGHRVGEVLQYAVATSSLAAERGGGIDATPTRAEALHQVGRMSRGRTKS
jgi:sugar/nucleoside kinase (ribokinase family)